MKVQEKKTQKGSSYAIIKFSDLSNVFELFIFSEIFEINRQILVEGNSLMLTLIKNYTDDTKSQKRINVKKIISLKDVVDKPISNVTFRLKSVKDFKKLNSLSATDGETDIKVLLEKDNEILTFNLKNKRKVNYKLLNSLNLTEYVIIE